MDVHLKNKYIDSKAQAKDSCYSLILIYPKHSIGYKI